MAIIRMEDTKLKEEAADRSVWRTCLVQRLWSCRMADQRVKGCGKRGWNGDVVTLLCSVE